MEPPSTNVTRCENTCPICNETYKDYIMPVKRNELSQFLTDTFINNPTGEITPEKLVQKLMKSTDVGTKIYN